MTTETPTLTPNWHLIALTPDLGNISFPIAISMSIGRQDSNDVVLASPQISRQHAKFNQVGKNLFLQDLGSANGTFVNGERISTQAVQVTPNDEIAFADLLFVVSQEDLAEKSVLDTVVDTTKHTVQQTPVPENPTPQLATQSPAIDIEKPSADSNSEDKRTAQADTQHQTPTNVIETAHTTTQTYAAKQATTANEPTTISQTAIGESTTTPIANRVIATPDSVPKKSPMLWIVAILILLMIVGMVLLRN